MASIHSLIDNDLPSLEQADHYAAILGENPSQGARSPLLWNAAFKGFGINCEMLPMDISIENLPAAMSVLDNDQAFIGGAIAVPHKETIAQWLTEQSEERLSPEARAIGAVNCLYRNEKGVLCATNTDGEGALQSLVGEYGDLQGAKVLLIGPGGAGKAVAAFVKSAIGEAGELILSARRVEKLKDFADRLSAKLVDCPPASDVFNNIDVIINASIVGTNKQVSESMNLIDYTALSALDEANQEASLQLLKKQSAETMVFDIIYDPSSTQLLNLAKEAGLKVLNGDTMNLEQAVIAFQYATGVNDIKKIRTIMDKARAA